MSHPQQNPPSRLEKKNSFEKKNSMVQVTESGLWQRPNISRIASHENEAMPEKIYKLMSSYLPKDISNIESLYPYPYLESSITSNTPSPEPDSTSKPFIAIRQLLIQSETVSLNTSMILIDV